MRVDALWMHRRNVRKERKKTWERRDRYKYWRDMKEAVSVMERWRNGWNDDEAVY